MMEERDQLRERTEKLDEFIVNNPLFLKLPGGEASRMRRQYSAMIEYLTILSDRVAAATDPK